MKTFGEFLKVEQEEGEFPGKYLMTMTYELSSPVKRYGRYDGEDWEYGPEGEKYNSLGKLLRDDPVYDLTWSKWSVSSPSGTPTEWIDSEWETNWETEESTKYKLFVKREDGKNLSPEEIKFINKELGIKQ